jgi:hypothetical protein
MWNCVRHSNVNKTWSSMLKKVGLPDFFCIRLSFSPIKSHIRRKVAGLITHSRLNFSGDRCFMFS